MTRMQHRRDETRPEPTRDADGADRRLRGESDTVRSWSQQPFRPGYAHTALAPDEAGR